MQKFIKHPKNFLVYCGGAGIGKTYFCASLFDWIYHKYDSYRYWTEYDLLKRVRASMDEYKGDYQDNLKYLIDDELLILDDIGSNGYTDFREEILFSVLDQRYNFMKPTIITSNLIRKEFKQVYHTRIYSRLFAQENIIIEVLDGEDKRNPL